MIDPQWKERQAAHRAGLEERSGIGGSDAAAVFNLGRKSSAQLWAELKGLVEREQPEGEWLEWGHLHEPTILRAYAMREGVAVMGLDRDFQVVRFMPDGTIRAWDMRATKAQKLVSARKKLQPVRDLLDKLIHPHFPWMTGHLDGVAHDEDGTILHLVDAKTAQVWMASRWGEEETDQIPEEYGVQFSHYQEICRALTGQVLEMVIPMLLGGATWRVYRWPYDSQIISLVVQKEKEFWASLDTDEMPPVSRDEKGLELLKKVYPKGQVQAAPYDVSHHTEWVQAGNNLYAAREQLKAAKDQEAAAKVVFQEFMASRSFVTCEASGWKATWKNDAPSKKVDWQGLAVELGKVVGGEQYATLKDAATTEKTGARRFLFKDL